MVVRRCDGLIHLQPWRLTLARMVLSLERCVVARHRSKTADGRARAQQWGPFPGGIPSRTLSPEISFPASPRCFARIVFGWSGLTSYLACPNYPNCKAPVHLRKRRKANSAVKRCRYGVVSYSLEPRLAAFAVLPHRRAAQWTSLPIVAAHSEASLAIMPQSSWRELPESRSLGSSFQRLVALSFPCFPHYLCAASRTAVRNHSRVLTTVASGWYTPLHFAKGILRKRRTKPSGR